MITAARRFRRTVAVLFVLYALIMLWLLFAQRISPLTPGHDYLQLLQGRINLIPFRTIDEFITAPAHGISRSHAFINLAGNVVMFIPLGAALPTLWTRLRSFGRCMGYSALILLTVELVQLFTLLGSADIDDLILNLVGTAMGFGIFRLLNKWKRVWFM